MEAVLKPFGQPVAPWAHDRPARNNSPGDLRPRSHFPPWPGQVSVDDPEGRSDGPYAIFASASDGWCALGLWLLYAHDIEGLKTTTAKINVFAPPGDNNPTGSYAAGVAARVGENANPHNVADRTALAKAISHWEDYRVVWPEDQIVSGMLLCDARWPTFLAGVTRGTVASPPQTAQKPPQSDVTDDDADALNAAELSKIEDGQTS